jgi:hypothetical protein
MSEYKSPYAANIGRMSNSEICSLAKNRFTDEETQIAIAKYHYSLARQHLAANPDVSPKAADILWNRKGYVLKCALLANGKKELSDEELTQFYRMTFKNRRNRKWRMQQAFLGEYRWRSSNNNSKTPGVLLEEIYADMTKDDPKYPAYLASRFVEHPNCTLDLALRISTMKVSDTQMLYERRRWLEVKHQALMKVAEITKREGATSR